MGTRRTGKMSGQPRTKAAGRSKKTGFRVSQKPVGAAGAPKVEGDSHKYEVAPGAEPAVEETHEQLPASYGGNLLFLTARDPHWLFAYWDIDSAELTTAETRGGERRFYLRLLDATGKEHSTHEVNPDARNWYLPVNEPNASFTSEFGYFDRDDQWRPIVRSNPATTPRDTLAGEAAQFATVPFALSFDRIVEMVKAAMQEGETLVQAISRLQEEGRRLLFGSGKRPEWTSQERQVLTALLGSEVMEKLGNGSEEIDRLLRKQLLEKLHSEAASGLSVSNQLAQLFGPAVMSLFSGIGASWSAAALGVPLGASLGGASLGGASWAGGIGASWSGAVGASWSAQPFSEQRERGFFMHVNAEVIFYGGTHPDAKVTVGGEHIPLRPDGSFRYHFRFPEGDFDIPIVAQSPDGVETRSATLTFKRETARKGEVGRTAQPAHLPSEPMGRKK